MKKKKKGSASIITSTWYSQNEASQKAAPHKAEKKQDSTEATKATMIYPKRYSGPEPQSACIKPES